MVRIRTQRVGLSLTSVLLVGLFYLIYKIAELEGWGILEFISKWLFYFATGYVALTIVLGILMLILVLLAFFVVKRAKKKGFKIHFGRKPANAQPTVIDVSNDEDTQ